MPDINFQQEAEGLRDELIARRRDLHRHPELGFEEVRTASIVARELSQLGLEVQTGVGKTGVVGLLEGGREGPTILVRADMDALPIEEENAVEYVSSTPGVMHACGHDGHTSILLGVAKLLAKRRDQMVGRVKFVFQPAEELGYGAKAMIEDGVLDNPRPDVSLGMHLWNGLPFGTLGVASGAVMAAVSIFTATITGKGGHAAMPHTLVDPIVCAAHMISALQTIVSRNVEPLECAVVSVTSVRAGETYNVIPQEVTLKGTFRAYNAQTRDLLVRRAQEIGMAVCSALGCTLAFEVQHQTDAVINHPQVSEKLRGVFREVVADSRFDQNFRVMGGEDMSYLMADIPGMYFFVGAMDSTAPEYYGHHHPRFSIDENALPLSVALMSAAVASYVLPD